MSENKITMGASAEQEYSIVYPKYVAYFSNDDKENINAEFKVARLFDETPEQVTQGKAPGDQFGWSRDGWVI